MSIKIAITNEKGGCGKTTSAVNISAILAERGYRVLLADVDPQSYATMYYGLYNTDDPSLYDAITGVWPVNDAIVKTVFGVDVLKSNTKLMKLEEKDKVQKIIKELKSVNLLDEVRQGLNQPNRLYLRYPNNSELIEMSIDFEDENEENSEQEPESPEKPSDYAERGKTALRSTEIPQSGLLKNRTPDCGKSEVKSAEISQSRVLKNRSLDFCKTAPNKTEYNKTEYNKTDSQSDGNFDFLMNADVPEDFAKACISLICEITTTPLSTVRIGKQVLPSTQVCQALHSLTPEHLQAVYRITKYSNNVRKPKGYLLALLYNAAQAAPESNLYAQFFAMPPEEHKPSFDIKLYEKYDIFDYLNEERSPEHGT